jgi:hypothetical protein
MTRLQRERRTVEVMIRMYCRRHHGQHKHPCTECSDILEYSLRKLDRCPFKDSKPSCARCAIHCYNKDMREKIRSIMRYAGPKMMWCHPILAVLHLVTK